MGNAQLKKKARLAETIIPETPRSVLHTFGKAFKPPKILTRHERRAIEKGSDNEELFHALILRLLIVMRVALGKTIISVHCEKSGHHDPENGIYDEDDEHGMDEKIYIRVRQGKGKIISYIFAYDAKSSQGYVDEYNIRQKNYPLPKGIDLKKAIRIPNRSEQNLIKEVLNDFRSILPKNIVFDPELILKHFSPV